MFEKVFEKRSDQSNDTSVVDWTKIFIENVCGKSRKDKAYFTCLDVIASNVARVSLELKKYTEDKGEVSAINHELYNLLRLRPNESMSTYDMLYTMTAIYKHYGIAGIYIDRFMGKVKGLYPVRIDNITIDNAGLIKSTMKNKILVDFTCAGAQGSCFESEIILLRDNTLDGIYGKAARTCIKGTIESNKQAEKYQVDLFSNGLTNKAVVQMTSDIKDEKDIKKIQSKFNRIFSSEGRIFTVPAGYNVSPLNLNLADSQFAELKVIGKKDISSVMHVPFSYVDDMKGLTEEDKLTLLDTISPIFIQFEQEADWKLLTSEEKKIYKIRFNISSSLRTTPKKQQEIICEYTKQGIYSLNYAKKLAGAPLLKKDVTVFPSGQVTLEQLIRGNVSYVDKSKGGDNNG